MENLLLSVFSLGIVALGHKSEHSQCDDLLCLKKSDNIVTWGAHLSICNVMIFNVWRNLTTSWEYDILLVKVLKSWESDMRIFSLSWIIIFCYEKFPLDSPSLNQDFMPWEISQSFDGIRSPNIKGFFKSW
jgi:hypothetical protein